MRTNAVAALPAVIQLLEPTNASRSMAISTVSQMGTNRTQAIPALIRLLSDPGSTPEAAWLLGEIGSQAHAAIPELRRALTDPRILQRDQILEALWRIDHDTNIVPLLALELEKTMYVATRWNILRVLGQIGPQAKPAIPSILRAISDPLADASPEGWRALRRIDPQGDQAEIAWSKLLNDRNPYARERAAMALWRITQDTNMVRVLVKELEKARTAEVFQSILIALGEIGPAAKEAVPLIQQKLEAALPADPNVAFYVSGQRATNVFQVAREALSKIDPAAVDDNTSTPLR